MIVPCGIPFSPTVRCLLLAGALSAGPLAQADLVPEDSPLGPGTHTLDTATGLTWLDLDLTAGLSFNETVSRLGGDLLGYRFATVDEVARLWTNAGIPDITVEGPVTADDFTQANLLPAEALVGLIGVTLESGLGTLAEGLTATAPVDDIDQRIVGELNLCTEPLCQFVFPNKVGVALASIGPNTKGVDEPVSFVGSYLVVSDLDPVSGSLAGAYTRYAVCLHQPTAATVLVPLAGTPSWDCTGLGAASVPGAQVLQVAWGIAACAPGAPCPVTGTVTGLADVLAVCRNLTTGQTRLATLGEGTYDCAAGGFAPVTRDEIQVILKGTIPIPVAD